MEKEIIYLIVVVHQLAQALLIYKRLDLQQKTLDRLTKVLEQTAEEIKEAPKDDKKR